MENTEKKEFHQVIFLTSIILLSWWLMQVVHEAGHCVGAWATGGTVFYVDLHPLRISHTLVEPNPNPVIVSWSGPIGGCVIPLLLWVFARFTWPSIEFLLRFFVGFCFIANGAYIGTGFYDPVGDAHDLIRYGISPWQLGMFGLITLPVVFLFWHGLGVEFGLGVNAKPVK